MDTVLEGLLPQIAVLSEFLPPGIDIYVASFLVSLTDVEGFHIKINTCDEFTFWVNHFNIKLDLRQLHGDALVYYAELTGNDSLEMKFELMMRGSQYYDEVFDQPLLYNVSRDLLQKIGRMCSMREYIIDAETDEDERMKSMVEQCSFIHQAEEVLTQIYMLVWPPNNAAEDLTYEHIDKMRRRIATVIDARLPHIFPALEPILCNQILFTQLMNFHNATDLTFSFMNEDGSEDQIHEHIRDHLADLMYTRSLMNVGFENSFASAVRARIVATLTRHVSLDD